MTRTHGRSASPDPGDPSSLIKRLKTSHVSSESTSNGVSEVLIPHSVPVDPASYFANELFDHNNIAQLHSGYLTNQPFKYAVVEKLFQDDLLRKVKDECVSELSFTEKETDIYKVNQTGDLASLNYLSQSQISLLPNLLALRDALYSSTFRSFLQAVTGCGPLSGKKQDMSVNSYTRGCHLLNHDDVIGTRRVSYILYMPLPNYTLWQKEWGGALELYPVKEGLDGHLEPESIPSKSIPPSWNQFILFEVQPGRSFHSVEEVVVGGSGEDGRERLSISGWFHAAQEGEDGYMPDSSPSEVKSSREQLTSTSTVFKDYNSSPNLVPENPLSEDHVSFLLEFLNPVYLQPRTMKALAARFVEESSLELHSFLSSDLANAIETRLRELDTKDGLGEERAGQMPAHTAGTDGGWVIKGPPHKWRYCALKPQEEGRPAEAVTPRAAYWSSDQILRSLQDELFSSEAFRVWLAFVSRLMPMSYSSEARRFRPGLDYTLATSEDSEARLDAVLGLTPMVQDSEEPMQGRFGHGEPEPRGWQTALWGGWECYMAPHNEEDDPAVYRSGNQKKRVAHPKETSKQLSSTPPGTSNESRLNKGHPGSGSRHISPPFDQMEDDVGEDDEDEDESTLLTVQPGFNRLLLVLRDERVMRFVKYVSAAAEGSRWDVCAEYEVGVLQQDSDDDANT